MEYHRRVLVSFSVQTDNTFENGKLFRVFLFCSVRLCTLNRFLCFVVRYTNTHRIGSVKLCMTNQYLLCPFTLKVEIGNRNHVKHFCVFEMGTKMVTRVQFFFFLGDVSILSNFSPSNKSKVHAWQWKCKQWTHSKRLIFTLHTIELLPRVLKVAILYVLDTLYQLQSARSTEMKFRFPYLHVLRK